MVPGICYLILKIQVNFVKALDYGTVLSEFELQSRYNVHFRTNTLEKGMDPLILPTMG